MTRMNYLTLSLILSFAFFSVSFGTPENLVAQDLPFQDKILPALFNPRIQQELEITEKQLQKIKDIFDGIRTSQREYGAQLKEFTKSGATKEEVESKRKEFIAKLEERKDEVAGDAYEVLLPHQMKRLKQVTIQVMMRESAKENKKQSGLLTKEMMAFLEIDEKQADKIKNKSIELQKKLLKEYNELKEKYTKELLGELTAKQRKKYEEAIGETYEQFRKR